MLRWEFALLSLGHFHLSSGRYFIIRMCMSQLGKKCKTIQRVTIYLPFLMGVLLLLSRF